MQDVTLKLPVGMTVNGSLVKEAPFAETGSEAEEVYTGQPAGTKLYTWFAEVLAVSIASIGGEAVARPFIKDFHKTRKVPKVVLEMPLNDVGTAMLQIQRHCWQDIMPNKQVQCKMCANLLTVDIDLNRIEVNVDPVTQYTEILVHLAKTYTIEPAGLESLEVYKGVEYNALRFRVPVLGDAIRHEKLMVDDVLFWRNIAFDCLESLVYVAEAEQDRNALKEDVAEGYVGVRGQLLFTVDLGSKDLRAVRAGLTQQLPSAKFYYEDTCGCGKYQIPMFTDVSSFFS